MPSPIDSLAHPAPQGRLLRRHEPVRTGGRGAVGDSLEPVNAPGPSPSALSAGGFGNPFSAPNPPGRAARQKQGSPGHARLDEEATTVEAKHRRHGVRPSL